MIALAGFVYVIPGPTVLSAPKCPSEPSPLLFKVRVAVIEGMLLANTLAVGDTLIDNAVASAESYPQVNVPTLVAVTVPDNGMSPRRFQLQ